MTDVGSGLKAHDAGSDYQPDAGSTRGSHAEFADLYEKFLDAAYDSSANVEPGNGRWLLIRQVANEIRLRGARHVLDCAVGTGFPALNLASMASDYGIETLHTTDGDPEMIRVLRRRAARLGITLPGPTAGGIDPLVLLWADLRKIHRTYDYVLCRGNSLAYADTWTGGQKVPSRVAITHYLRQIADRVRPGGHLHIDAPWRTDLECRKYRPVASGAVTIWEQVTTEPDHRLWRMTVKLPTGRRIKFERFSSRLTIQDVAEALDGMGFEETEPLEMAGERPNFGVIIAKRPSI